MLTPLGPRVSVETHRSIQERSSVVQDPGVAEPLIVSPAAVRVARNVRCQESREHSPTSSGDLMALAIVALEMHIARRVRGVDCVAPLLRSILERWGWRRYFEGL